MDKEGAIMQKVDLKDWMRVELRNGDRYIVADEKYEKKIIRAGIGVEQRHWQSIEGNYSEDLTHECVSKYDIVMVFEKPVIYWDYLNVAYVGKLIWKRPAEKMIMVNGKPYSESTIQRALQQYVSD